MPVAVLLRTISSSELTEWAAWFQIEYDEDEGNDEVEAARQKREDMANWMDGLSNAKSG